MSEGDLASSKLSGLMRTHTCGELRESDIGKEVTLCGWNNKYRDLGGLHFIDVRDKYGMTQLAFDEFEEDITKLKSLSLETVVKISGVVRQRPDSAINKDMDTGGVEVSVRKLEELSHAAELPFLPQSKVATSENLKLKYRYLDLRNKHLQDILSTRSNVMRKVRCALYEEEFTEVETPILYKTTPEGARDYVVPSRIHKGQFYALPQSPQTLKQLLMIANTDKYFQICKCFRDEDLRADRQPEFSQIDIEVSFATQEYIKNLTTKVVRSVFDLKSDFEIPVMSYDQALEDYGTDKPDLRFGLKHFVVNDLMNGLGFKVFQDAIDGNGLVKTFFVPKDMKEFSRKELDGLGDIVKPYGGKGVAWFKVSSEGIVGGISKFINDETLKKLQERISASEGTFLFFADVKESVAHASGDAARRHLGKELGLIDPNEYKFLWVNDWPLLDYDEEEKRFYAVHHPFTMFKSEDEEKYRSGDVEQLKTVRADAYDIVCNGYEMGGGSLRIYKEDIQQKMFEYLGMEESEIKAKFGFFIEALKYGTPPHGGFAFGLDRTVMLVTHTDNIRDVISFPKTNQASDLMSASPSAVTQEQLDELSLIIRE